MLLFPFAKPCRILILQLDSNLVFDELPLNDLAVELIEIAHKVLHWNDRPCERHWSLGSLSLHISTQLLLLLPLLLHYLNLNLRSFFLSLITTS